MNLQRVVLRGSLLFNIFLFLMHVPAAVGQVQPRVVDAVDNTKRITLKGNVHPLARTEFDKGQVVEAQPMKRILLLLKRSDEQEAALQAYLEQQQSKSSANYHAWLTPEQFGAKFGPADADVQAVRDWLTRQGFTIEKIYSGKTVIEFSGTAGQVACALGTSIHNYLVDGKLYSANASDPQIPAALAPVVTGVVSLHNFPRQLHSRYLGEFRRTPGKPGLQPLFTFPRPNGTGNFYGMGPGDFATIYNSKTLIGGGNNGTGQTIGIVGETQLNPQDVMDFRALFGLPANFTASNIILNGEDPGITSVREESEADLDVQWSGATAPGATVKYVVSASTPASSGVDLSALYIIEHNLADVMSESYGDCEKNLGTTGNNFYNALWEQAAAQGITVMVSSGDGGSAGCDNFDTPQGATQGLAVSGIAGTPFNVSVGGTDFDQRNNPTLYWNTTNDAATGTSAIGYIPEIPWNESCAQIGLAGCGASAPDGSLNILAGSGGPSSLYGKPAWQMGVAGVPNDNHRDQPDVSLFASPGFDDTGYVVCQQDRNLNGLPTCDLNTTNGYLDFHVIGGTSASSPAFAGVMALVNQYQAGHGGSARQGNANQTLYALAKKPGASCTSSTTEATGCVFNDVVMKGNSYIAAQYGSSVGTNSVACQGGTPDCSVAIAGSNGVLVDPAHTSTEAWTAGTSYDMATGLGTVNVNNLATQWGTVSTVKTSTALTLSPTSGITHGTGENVTVNISVTPSSGTATGNVSLIATLQGPSGTTTQGLDQFTLDATGKVTNATTKSLPGGTNYTVTAHYSGDGTNAPSDSAPVTVSVGQESSQTFIVIPSFDSNGNLVNGNATTLTYGTRYILRMYVADKNALPSANGPPSPACYNENLLTCPTGTVTLTDNGAPVDTGGGGPGIYNLNGEGYTRDLVSALTGGSHMLVATYSGDSSYTGSTSSTHTLTVIPAITRILPSNPPLPPQVSTPFNLAVILTTDVFGVMPSCNFTFYDGTTALPGTVTCAWQANGPFLYTSLPITQATSGTHSYTAKFAGDQNYAPSTSSAMITRVFQGTTTTLTADSLNVQYGTNINLTAVVDSTVSQGPPISQTVTFLSDNNPVTGTVTYTPFSDSSGNIALRANITTQPQSSGFYSANFRGDSTYGQSGALINVTVNIPDFSVPNQVTLTVPAGQSASTTLTVTPVTNQTSQVQFTLQQFTNYAPGVNCSVSPNPVTLSGQQTASATFSCSVPAASTSTSTTFVIPWPQSSEHHWWILGGTTLLLGSILLLLPSRLKMRKLAFACYGLSVIGLALGCGGGGGSTGGGGGGGGGGQTQTPTSVSLSVPSTKIAFGSTLTATISVTGTQSPTGTVTLYDSTTGIGTNASLVNGQGQASLNLGGLGAHNLIAKYSGDTKNLASQTQTPLVEVVTGSPGGTWINASTGTDVKQINVNLTVQ